jgi:hypothetical protein
LVAKNDLLTLEDMDSPLPSEAELRADFEQKRRNGIIFYDDKPKLQTCTIDGFQVIITLCTSLSNPTERKPAEHKHSLNSPSRQPSARNHISKTTSPSRPQP